MEVRMNLPPLAQTNPQPIIAPQQSYLLVHSSRRYVSAPCPGYIVAGGSTFVDGPSDCSCPRQYQRGGRLAERGGSEGTGDARGSGWWRGQL
jgi:hypothetical protein